MEAAEITKTIAQIRDYDYGRPTTALLAVERMIHETQGDGRSREQIETELAGLLESSATFACKQFVCEKLWIMGTDASVPVLRGMLASADPHIVEAGCYALSERRSPAVTEAVADGLRKAKDKGLIAVINLAGSRREPECAGRLAELALAEDAPTANAAIAALGRIASTSAVEALTKLHTGARSMVAADALLQAGQELAARGKRAEARAVYAHLAAGSASPAVHRGALLLMHPPA